MPEPAIDRAILDGAIQFCRDSLVWQEHTDPISVLVGVAEYAVEPASDAEPIRVLAAVKAHEHLDRKTAGAVTSRRWGDVMALCSRLQSRSAGKRAGKGRSIVLRVALRPKTPRPRLMTARALLEGADRRCRRQRLALTYGDSAGRRLPNSNTIRPARAPRRKMVRIVETLRTRPVP